MSEIEGVINQNFKNSISQKCPNRSFLVIHQNDRIFILHIAAHSVFMAIFFNPKFCSGAVCFIFCQNTSTMLLTLRMTFLNNKFMNENGQLAMGKFFYEKKYLIRLRYSM